jgi:serine/threonine-protein kinase
MQEGEPVPDEPEAKPVPDMPSPDVAEDPRRAEVVAWLGRECRGCHGNDEEPGVTELNGLLASQWLIAGSAEVSPLVLWLQYGSSRRDHAGIQVSPEEFDTLVGYLNAVPVAVSGVGYDTVDRDRAYELMVLDIMTREAADRPFIRYVGFGVATPSGSDRTRLDRAAFVQLLNGVSLGATIVPPAELNVSEITARPLYALDIRDYGWTTPVDVGGPGGRHFEERWSAIVAAVGPEAMELGGPEADVLKRETQTPIPFLTAAQFVAAAAVGDLYSALVGVGVNANELLESLGVDDAGLWRAGVFGVDGLLPDRVVTWREQRAYPGHSWWTRQELPRGSAAEGLAADPVSFPNEGGEVIFTLPNGLFAYAIVGSDGGSGREIPSCIGGIRCPTAVRAENSVTCRACHARLIGVTDEVLPYLDAGPGRYTAELDALIREQYRPEIWRAFEADVVVHDAAVEASGASEFDVVARQYFERTRRPLDLDRAADDLGISAEQLRGGIEALGTSAPELAPLLSNGLIEREQLSRHVLPLSCAITGLRNRPATCP